MFVCNLQSLNYISLCRGYDEPNFCGEGSKSVNWVLSVAITKDGTSQPSPIRLSVFYPVASHPEDITHPPSTS